MSSSTYYYCDPDLYDVIYSDVTADIPFWAAQAKAAGGPVLELCCGTGRVLVPCAAAGARMDGLDLTPAMVEACRARLAASGLKAEVAVGDMRDFTRPHRYALIFIPFNSFLHNSTQAEQVATLRCCREHLESDGRLMLTVFHPRAGKLVEHDGTPRLVKTIPHPAGAGSVRMTDTGRCDAVEQRIQVEREVEMLDAGGAVLARHELKFDLRYVYKPEMELLLHAAGFPRCAVQGGFGDGETPRDGDHLTWTAWKD